MIEYGSSPYRYPTSGKRQTSESGSTVLICRRPRSAVAKYVSFFSYTTESIKGMMDRPSDRTAAAKVLVESLGGTMEAFYWMQGQHDGLLITELPDSVNGAALSAAVIGSGAVSRAETHQLFDSDQQTEIIKLAGSAIGAYKTPA